MIAKIAPTVLQIRGSNVEWKFDLVKGRLSSWSKGSKNILNTGPALSFFRALTDNDGTDGKDWTAKEVGHLIPHTRSVTWEMNDKNGTAVLKCFQRVAPPALEWSIDATTTYTFDDAHVIIHVTGKPQGINLPQTLPRIGLDLSVSSDFNKATWFGRGPGESYKDKKLSQRFGNYSAAIDDLAPEYEFPQESGNHTETKWVRFDSPEGVSLAAKFLNRPEGFDFQASHYHVLDVDNAKHPYELRKMRRNEVIVRLDMDHHGLGTGSCGMYRFLRLDFLPSRDFFFGLSFEGLVATVDSVVGPKTLPQYALKTSPFEFTVVLE
jgi:beta-galactosidase